MSNESTQQPSPGYLPTPGTTTTPPQPQPESEAPTPPKFNIKTIDQSAPPPPDLTSAGEAAMLSLGLSNHTTPHLHISPWWTGPNVHPRFGTKEFWAQQCAKYRRYAQHCTKKSEKWRDVVQHDLLFRRSESFSLAREQGTVTQESANTTNVWLKSLDKENDNWLEGKWEWESKEEKRFYKKACRRMERYREKSLITITREYYCALNALEAPGDEEVWGGYFES